VSLGFVFRVHAERSLITALDREMRLQATRFRDTQRLQVVFLGDNAHAALGDGARKALRAAVLQTPGGKMVVSHSGVELKPPAGAGAELLIQHGSEPSNDTAAESRRTIRVLAGTGDSVTVATELRTQYRVTSSLGAAPPDVSGQFLYRSFDLKGQPISPAESNIPFQIPFHGDNEPAVQRQSAPHYRPWDLATFAEAARGRSRFADIISNGARMRLLSIPLVHEERIAGVVQIAAPLAQLDRDIAGLTHALLLVLPMSLLVAVIAGIFLTQRALRPVKEMTRAAAGIRPDQLSRRLPVTGLDEFSELAFTFNGALDRVENAFIDRERAIAQLRRFTADASHELRTPLTTIKTNTGVALTDTEPSAEHIHALRQIDRAADRMTALVQDLLLLARSDAGQLTLELAPVSLPEVIQDAVDSLPGTNRAPIEVEVSGTDGMVAGDYEHLRRLFLNLLQNAIRHTPPDGKIAVSIEKAPGGLAARVRDTGSGIAPEHLPHVGQPFYRADSGRNRKYGGAGLGLAICSSIAAAHRASMNVASIPGSGTAVTVTFPDPLQDFVRIA
jgi:signal transduction histidine kinase